MTRLFTPRPVLSHSGYWSVVRGRVRQPVSIVGKPAGQILCSQLLHASPVPSVSRTRSDNELDAEADVRRYAGACSGFSHRRPSATPSAIHLCSSTGGPSPSHPHIAHSRRLTTGADSRSAQRTIRSHLASSRTCPDVPPCWFLSLAALIPDIAGAAGTAECYTGEFRKPYDQPPEDRPPCSGISGNRSFRSQLTRRGRNGERKWGAVVALVAVIDTPHCHYCGVCFSDLHRDWIVSTVDCEQPPLGKIAQPQRVEQVFCVRLVARFAQGKSEKSSCLEHAIEFVKVAEQFVIVVTAVLTPALRNHDPTVEPRGDNSDVNGCWHVPCSKAGTSRRRRLAVSSRDTPKSFGFIVYLLWVSRAGFPGAATVLHDEAEVKKTGNGSKSECRRAGSPAVRSFFPSSQKSSDASRWVSSEAIACWVLEDEARDRAHELEGAVAGSSNSRVHHPGESRVGRGRS